MTTLSRSLDDNNVLGDVTTRVINHNNIIYGLARLNTNFSQDFDESTSKSRTNSCENSPINTNTPANPFPNSLSPRKNSSGIPPTSLLQKPNSRKNSFSSENPRINSETNINSKINSIILPKDSQGTFSNSVNNKKTISGFSSAENFERENVLEEDQVDPTNSSCLQKNKDIVQPDLSGCIPKDKCLTSTSHVIYNNLTVVFFVGAAITTIKHYCCHALIKENQLNLLFSLMNNLKDDLLVYNHQLVSVPADPKRRHGVGEEETL